MKDTNHDACTNTISHLKKEIQQMEEAPIHKELAEAKDKIEVQSIELGILKARTRKLRAELAIKDKDNSVMAEQITQFEIRAIEHRTSLKIIRSGNWFRQQTEILRRRMKALINGELGGIMLESANCCDRSNAIVVLNDWYFTLCRILKVEFVPQVEHICGAYDECPENWWLDKYEKQKEAGVWSVGVPLAGVNDPPVTFKDQGSAK